jgi:hypothetical protein
MDFSLSIGLDEYIKLNPPTPYAENDATCFDQVMKETYVAEYSSLIIGNNATYKNIEYTIQDIASKIESTDRFFLFYAGHGENINGVPHISCFDSDPVQDDSWHNLIDLMETINSSGCNKLLFFIDACESTLKLGSRKKKVDKFSTEELEEHLNDSNYSCVFSATSHKGVADIIPASKHGIWSYYLLQGLSGKAPKALSKKDQLTNYSLQKYLSISVKKYCKGKPGVTLQNAFTWGKEEGEFLIKDFKKGEVQLYQDIPESSIRRIELITQSEESVRNLSGFKKRFHSVPEYKSSTAEGFISSISEKEVKEQMENVSSSLRNLLKLRRKDFEITIEGGYSLFECPYFNYDYSIELQEEDPSTVVFTGRLTPIDIDKLIAISSEIDSCFPEWFDTLIYNLSKSLNLNQLIDRIEENDDEAMEDFEIDYDTEVTYIEFFSKKLGRTVIIKPHEVEFSFNAQEDIPDMLEGLKELSNQLLLVSSDYKLLD